VITNLEGRELEMEVKSLQEKLVSLKKAIEGEIREGQKSIDDLNDITTYGLVLNKAFAITCRNARLGVVGWVDDF
jgi:hypothetical protein